MYRVRISFFDSADSRRRAKMISWILRRKVRSGVRMKVFTTCWVMVDAPCLVLPERRLVKNARTMPR
jgi:hypothetical protein